MKSEPHFDTERNDNELTQEGHTGAFSEEIELFPRANEKRQHNRLPLSFFMV